MYVQFGPEQWTAYHVTSVQWIEWIVKSIQAHKFWIEFDKASQLEKILPDTIYSVIAYIILESDPT